jgi:hypothetical protein
MGTPSTTAATFTKLPLIWYQAAAHLEALAAKSTNSFDVQRNWLHLQTLETRKYFTQKERQNRQPR